MKQNLTNSYKTFNLKTKENYESDIKSNFTGILEIIASEANIITSIHKIKANKGSHTAGIDEKEIDDYLNKGFDEVIEIVRAKLYDYNPSMVRRVWIPKPGKSEKDHLEFQRLLIG